MTGMELAQRILVEADQILRTANRPLTPDEQLKVKAAEFLRKIWPAPPPEQP